jgi:hypothetical protein
MGIKFRYRYILPHLPHIGGRATQKPKTGRDILKQLQKTVKQGGGVEGFLKFEITKNLYNQGFSLPPILMG